MLLVLLVLLAPLLACSSPSFELLEGRVSASGGERLHLRGDFSGHGAVIVSVDGVPARAVVIDGAHSIEVELPPLPRAGFVEVELRFADGHELRREAALEVVSPPSPT